MVHHPAGTSRATGQAPADIPTGRLCQSRTLRPVERRTDRRIVTTPVAALPERRMQRDKTPNEAPEGATYLLRQAAPGASSDPSGQARGQVSTHPEGDDPDRRRSLGFLTSTDHPHPEVPDTSGPRRARPPPTPHAEVPGNARPRSTRPKVDQNGRMLRGPRCTRAPQHEGVLRIARPRPLSFR